MIKIQILSMVSAVSIGLSYHCKVKTINSNHFKLGNICTSIRITFLKACRIFMHSKLFQLFTKIAIAFIVIQSNKKQ